MIHIFTRFKIHHKIYITSFLSLQMVKLIRSSRDSISILVSRPGASRHHIEKQKTLVTSLTQSLAIIL